MPNPEFKSKRHDDGISPELTFTPPPGVTWDLEEAGIAVKLIARLPNATEPKINASAVVTGPWAIRYDPTPQDVDTIGGYDVEVEITRSDGKKVTLPTVGFLRWTIAADLDNS